MCQTMNIFMYIYNPSDVSSSANWAAMLVGLLMTMSCPDDNFVITNSDNKVGIKMAVSLPSF